MLVAVFSFSVNGFFAVKNFENITRQITTVGIVSIGMTLVILTGGIDLSVGSIVLEGTPQAIKAESQLVSAYLGGAH